MTEKKDLNYPVLVVDDEPIMRQIIRGCLEDFGGFTVEEASDGIEALDILEKNRDFDCIILDLLMPKLSGFELIRLLRERYPLFRVPIIISSADENDSSIYDALNAGCTDYFRKPLSQLDLSIIFPLKVRNAISLYSLQKSLEQANQRLNEDLSIAMRFQKSLLPQPHESERLFVEFLYRPYFSVGGDFIDFREEDDRFYLFIADVSGHGVAASMLSSLLKVEFQEQFGGKHRENEWVKQFVASLNKKLMTIFKAEMFITCFVAEINFSTNLMTYVNAAHPGPVYRSFSGKTIDLAHTNGLVGVFPNFTPKTGEIAFERGDRLLAFTDGAFEFVKKRDGTLYSVEELNAHINLLLGSENQVGGLERLYAAIREDAEEMNDDVLLFFLEKNC